MCALESRLTGHHASPAPPLGPVCLQNTMTKTAIRARTTATLSTIAIAKATSMVPLSYLGRLTRLVCIVWYWVSRYVVNAGVGRVQRGSNAKTEDTNIREE